MLFQLPASPTPHITRRAGLAGALLITAMVLGVPLQAAMAQTSSTPLVVGAPIIAKARGGSDTTVQIRTPAMMAAAEASLPKSAMPRLPFRTTLDPSRYAAEKAAADRAHALSTAPKPQQLTSSGPYIAPSIIILNKPGPTQNTPGDADFPPDTEGAIGPTQIVYTVNQTINVYNRGGGLLKSTTFPAFFGTTDALSDPRVTYDTLWNRWVVTDTRVPPGSGDTVSACFWIAASTTSSATGSWITGRSCQGGGIFANGDLWDYDQMGMTQDAILVTGNIFGASFKGPAVVAIPKALLYNGFGWSYPIYAPGTSVGTIAPPLVQDSNADAYFVATDSNTSVIDLFVGSNLANEFQATYSLQAQIPVATYASPPSARQPGTTAVLDSLDGRFQNSSPQYGNKLWNVHTVALGSFPAPTYYEIDTSANSIIQQGTFFESGTSDDFNPSISANNGDEAFVAWSTTDALGTTTKHDARVRVSGRQSTDPLGTITAGSTLFTSTVALTGNTQNGIQRWGDYSRVALDPVSASCGANQRAAVFDETILNANAWSTRFGIIGYCN